MRVRVKCVTEWYARVCTRASDTPDCLVGGLTGASLCGRDGYRKSRVKHFADSTVAYDGLSLVMTTTMETQSTPERHPYFCCEAPAGDDRLETMKMKMILHANCFKILPHVRRLIA